MDRITELNNSVDDLSREARELRAEIRRRTRAVWVAVGVLVVVSAVMAYLIAGNSRQIDENNKKFCPLVSILIPGPGEPQSSTPRGVVVADQARVLFKEFHCE